MSRPKLKRHVLIICMPRVRVIGLGLGLELGVRVKFRVKVGLRCGLGMRLIFLYTHTIHIISFGRDVQAVQFLLLTACHTPQDDSVKIVCTVFMTAIRLFIAMMIFMQNPYSKRTVFAAL